MEDELKTKEIIIKSTKIKCPKCNKKSVKNTIVDKNKLMRTWCVSCGNVIEPDRHGKKMKVI